MNVDHAKFQKKFDGRTISRELPQFEIPTCENYKPFAGSSMNK